MQTNTPFNPYNIYGTPLWENWSYIQQDKYVHPICVGKNDKTKIPRKGWINGIPCCDTNSVNSTGNNKSNYLGKYNCKTSITHKRSLVTLPTTWKSNIYILKVIWFNVQKIIVWSADIKAWSTASITNTSEFAQTLHLAIQTLCKTFATPKNTHCHFQFFLIMNNMQRKCSKPTIYQNAKCNTINCSLFSNLSQIT